MRSAPVGMFCLSVLNLTDLVSCAVMHFGFCQVEVVVRTLKLVLRSFQRSWMKSEQSSSEQVHASLLIHTTGSSGSGTFEEFPTFLPCQPDLSDLFERRYR